MSGDAFFSTISNPTGTRNVKLIVVKADASHYASLAIIMWPAFTGASQADVDALLAEVRLTAAHPVEVRLPKSGDPAFSFTVPAAWAAKYDDIGTLTIKNQICGCAVVLYLESGDARNVTTAQVAANALKAMGAPAATTTAAGTLGGIPGDVYFSTMNNPNGGLFSLKVTIAKLDASHIAEMILITPRELSPARAADVDSVLNQIQFTGLAK